MGGLISSGEDAVSVQGLGMMSADCEMSAATPRHYNLVWSRPHEIMCWASRCNDSHYCSRCHDVCRRPITHRSKSLCTLEKERNKFCKRPSLTRGKGTL